MKMEVAFYRLAITFNKQISFYVLPNVLKLLESNTKMICELFAKLSYLRIKYFSDKID